MLRADFATHDGRALADVDLLVVAHSYNHFVKGQVDVLAEHVNSVHVLVRYNRFADVAEVLPIDYAKPFSRSAKIKRDGQPSNVTVTATPLLYLPVDAHRNVLGRQHARKVKQVVADIDTGFDLVHSHMTWTAGYAGLAAKRALDVPLVVTIHENRDLLLEEIEGGNDRMAETWRNADALVRVNEPDTELLSEYNDDVHYIPNGFPAQRFRRVPQAKARRELGVDPDRRLVFSLGHLKERKGFQHVVAAMPDIVDREDVLYAIGGHGGMKATLEDLVEKHDVAERVRLLGYVDADRLKYWMSAADVFVLPSYSESFGLVQLEAMACGTPVVATVNGGSEEVIPSEEYGYLVDSPEDHDALATTIVRALRTDWDRTAIADYARNLTWENVCEDIAALYTDLLDEHGTRLESAPSAYS